MLYSLRRPQILLFDKHDHECIGTSLANSQVSADIFGCVESFDLNQFRALADAMKLIHNTNPCRPLSGSEYLDKTTAFICNVTGFVKVGPIMGMRTSIWLDEATGEQFTITNEPELCPPGIASRLVYHHSSPLGSVSPPPYEVIVCPMLLTPTQGKPEMFATIDRQDLTNKRLNDGIDLNTVAYIGMGIDDLRDRVLSVWLGRMVIIIVAQKYGLDVLPRPGYRTYQQCAALELDGADLYVDSFRIFVTGKEPMI